MWLNQQNCIFVVTLQILGRWYISEWITVMSLVRQTSSMNSSLKLALVENFFCCRWAIYSQELIFPLYISPISLSLSLSLSSLSLTQTYTSLKIEILPSCSSLYKRNIIINILLRPFCTWHNIGRKLEFKMRMNLYMDGIQNSIIKYITKMSYSEKL